MILYSGNISKAKGITTDFWVVIMRSYNVGFIDICPIKCGAIGFVFIQITHI